MVNNRKKVNYWKPVEFSLYFISFLSYNQNYFSQTFLLQTVLSQSNLRPPMLTGDMDQDSEAETDPEWLRDTRTKVIQLSYRKNVTNLTLARNITFA